MKPQKELRKAVRKLKWLKLKYKLFDKMFLLAFVILFLLSAFVVAPIILIADVILLPVGLIRYGLIRTARYITYSGDIIGKLQMASIKSTIVLIRSLFASDVEKAITIINSIWDDIMAQI